jgi:hypothetical protein
VNVDVSPEHPHAKAALTPPTGPSKRTPKVDEWRQMRREQVRDFPDASPSSGLMWRMGG